MTDDVIDYEDVKMLHNPTQSAKIQGGPGAGKTTYAYATLARILTDDDLDYDVDDGTWVTYRRTLADETIDTLAQTEILDDDERQDKRKGKTRWISTLHAVCYRALDEAGELDGVQAADNSDKRDFIESTYDVSYYSRDTRDTPQQAAMQMLDYALKNDIHPSEVGEQCVHYDRYRDWTNAPTPTQLCEDWTKYKNEYNLIDFTEMLVMCRDLDVTPPLDWLVFDEAHDAYPIMQDLLDTWSGIADIAIVMGDIYQVINTYEGASAQYFAELKLAQHVTLPRSYRLPEDVYDAATHTLKTHTLRHTTVEMQADDRQGLVCDLQHSNIISTRGRTRLATTVDKSRLAQVYHSVDISNDMIILARTQYQVKQISEILSWLGIPHESQHNYRPSWDDEMMRLYNCLDKIRLHKCTDMDAEVTVDELESLYVYHESIGNASKKVSYMRRSDVDTVDVQTVLDKTMVSNFLESIESHSPIESTGISLDDDEMEYMLSRALNNDIVVDPQNIPEVKTIHAAKGLESDTVLVYDGAPVDTEQDVNDSEANVWYVALTRAYETCIVFRDAFDTHTMVPRDLPNSNPGRVTEALGGGA
jgi:superfamily I DNA/RNA helicase